jgi:hypothetical protein
VTVRVHDVDRYGRLVADAILSHGRNLHHELVKAGMAWWYRQYACNDATPAQLEAEAKAAKRGLWRDPQLRARDYTVMMDHPEFGMHGGTFRHDGPLTRDPGPDPASCRTAGRSERGDVSRPP